MDLNLPEDLKKVLTSLTLEQKELGIVIMVITRGDVEDAWRHWHGADDFHPEPQFTDELWAMYQETWSWQKGLRQSMYQNVYSTLENGIDEIMYPHE